MTEHADGTTDRSQDRRYRCLSHHRRRRILVILAESGPSLAVDDLAARLATGGVDETGHADGGGGTTDSGTDLDSGADAESIRIDLVHVHLPALVEADFVAWDRTAGTVSPTAGAARAARRGFTTPVRLDPSWDDLFAALANRRRRIACSVAAGHDGPLAVDTLVREIARRDADGRLTEIRTTFRHRHLPHLEAAGLLAVDEATRTVRFQGHPELADEWFVHDRRRPDLDEPFSVPAYGY